MKKRVVPFRLRVDAYLHEKIDRTLRTQEERESGTGPASLMPEGSRGAATSDRASNATAEVAPTKPPVPAEAVRAKVANAAGFSNGKSGKRSMDNEKLSDTQDTVESANKRQK